MKRRFLAGILSTAMLLTMTPVTPVSAAPEESKESMGKAVAVLSDEELGTNIALKATTGASYTNVWSISPTAMNDGKLAGSDPSSSWNSWGGGADQYPVTTEVHYVDAEGNPQRITGMVNEKGDASDEVGVVYDSSSNNGINGNNKYWNYVKFEQPITTKELQLKIERSGSGGNSFLYK